MAAARGISSRACASMPFRFSAAQSKGGESHMGSFRGVKFWPGETSVQPRVSI